PQIEQGQLTLIERWSLGVSMLPLSSVARLSIVVDGFPWAIQVYVQVALATAPLVSVAGCQVEPLSVDTSTPPTTPPADVAVPEIVTAFPSWTVAPADGELIVETGGVVLVDFVAETSPEIRLCGCTPMSAKRFTVACCIEASGESPSGLSASRPHTH